MKIPSTVRTASVDLEFFKFVALVLGVDTANLLFIKTITPPKNNISFATLTTAMGKPTEAAAKQSNNSLRLIFLKSKIYVKPKLKVFAIINDEMPVIVS